MKLDKTTHNIQHVLNMLQELELEVFKFKTDDNMCQCKKDIFTMLVRRLQYIVMLLSSTKYVYDDTTEFDKINGLVEKLLDDEELHIPEHASVPVAKLYLDILEQMFGSYKIFTKKLFSVNDFNTFLDGIEKRIFVLKKLIKFVFYIVYPNCSSLEDKTGAKCTQECLDNCVNIRLFGDYNVIYVPGDYLQHKKIYSMVYNSVWEALKNYCSRCYKIVVYDSSECDGTCDKDSIKKEIEDTLGEDIVIEFRTGIHLYFEKITHELLEALEICQLR